MLGGFDFGSGAADCAFWVEELEGFEEGSAAVALIAFGLGGAGWALAFDETIGEVEGAFRAVVL
jgi:hypothetical protein